MCIDEKGRNKTVSLFAGDMVIYVKNPKEFTKNTSRISEFHIFTVYETNIQKLIIFLYTSNEHVETEIKMCYL